MVLLIIAGLFALISGKIVITKKLHLTGKNARIYGGLLIVLSIPYAIFMNVLLGSLLPTLILQSDYAKPIINLVLLLIIAIGLAIPFRDK